MLSTRQLALNKLSERGMHQTGVADVPSSILTGGNIFAGSFVFPKGFNANIANFVHLKNSIRFIEVGFLSSSFQWIINFPTFHSLNIILK